MNLILKRDGRLEIEHDNAASYPESMHDVTRKAIEYLMEPVTLEENILIRDIFMVFWNNPYLTQVFQHPPARDIVARAIIHESRPYTPEYGPNTIEYIELDRYCMYDPEKATYHLLHYYILQGIGHVLREDTIEQDASGQSVTHPAGTRNLWSLGGHNARMFMNFPIRIAPLTRVYLTGNQYGESRLTDFGPPLLGQVLQTVLRELSSIGTIGGGDDTLNETKYNETDSLNFHIERYIEIVTEYPGCARKLTSSIE